MTVKELKKQLEQYDDNLEIRMPIWKSQGIIMGMEGTDGVYTSCNEKNEVDHLFIM